MRAVLCRAFEGADVSGITRNITRFALSGQPC
jgi:hypothetical protein